MFICLTLEELSMLKSRNEDTISVKHLYERISSKMSLSLKNTALVQMYLWIREMQLMGLIKISRSKKNDEIIINQLAEAGLQAFQKQTFHQIYANMISARESRKIAVVAIVISCLSLLMSILHFFIYQS